MTFRPHTRILAIVLTLALARAGFGVPSARADAPFPDSVRAVPAESLATDTMATRVQYLWVLRNTLVDSLAIPRLVERAKAMKVKGLLVQVVGRGDGWYRSDLLPYPEPLRTPGRDPLGELLPLAHAA